MQSFRWLGADPIPPPADLRRRGWRLIDTLDASQGEGRDASQHPMLLADATDPVAMRWLLADNSLLLRRAALVLNTPDSGERARLMSLGVGDALGPEATLAEVEARALRIIALRDLLPRQRLHGPLRLDLLARDGFVNDKPLGLHPREFSLIWRLLEVPGEQVDKTTLLRDVWRMSYIPETNSLAVHASRLRQKLSLAGLNELVQTAPAGGYFVTEPRPVRRRRQGAMAG